jgi:hypothetical protein
VHALGPARRGRQQLVAEVRRRSRCATLCGSMLSSMKASGLDLPR